jgi:hypothetical protein
MLGIETDFRTARPHPSRIPRRRLESVSHYDDPSQIAALADEADEADLAL